MCNTFLCTLGVSRGLKYKLILLNNRDELLDRRTSTAHWEHGYLAGHDEQEKERGTWLGVRKDGRIGNTLSITEPEHVKNERSNPPTRGTIVTDFLIGTKPAAQYCKDFTAKAKQYNGFQFLALERNSEDLYEVTSLTNRLVSEVKPYSWSEGTYCFGNSPHEKPMKKVEYGERIFKQFVDQLKPEDANEQTIVDGLMKIALDTSEHFPDNQLAEQTGRDESFNRHLSSIYIRFPPEIRYGTRSHTIILVDTQNQVYFRENRMQDNPPKDSKDAKWETIEFRFQLE